MRSESCFAWLLLVSLALVHNASMEPATPVNRGNDCPESKPWPCRTPNICLSFALICDGESDCPDEYDEDQEMCTAKLRPAEEHLQGFINKYREWLIPDILGDGKPEELATKLVESKNIVDYARSANLKPKQIQRLIDLLKGVKSGKQIALHMMGMPLGAWSELYVLFYRIYRSGFLDNVELVQTTNEKTNHQNFWRKRFYNPKLAAYPPRGYNYYYDDRYDK